MKVYLFICFSLFSLFSLFSQHLWAESKIETIQLNHRVAADVLADVQVFLPNNATARAFNEFIILKADPKVIKEIKQLINQLDTPLQRLKISILNTDQVVLDQHGNQVSGSLTVGSDSPSASIKLRRWSTQNKQNKEHSYQAQGIANRPILILIGEKIPQKEQAIRFNSFGDVSVQSSTYYIETGNGFQAIANILPNHRVSVDIHPRFSHFDRRTGSINNSEIITRISGPVGQWIELGKIGDTSDIDSQGVTRYQTHRQHHQTVYIKVEQLNN